MKKILILSIWLAAAIGTFTLSAQQHPAKESPLEMTYLKGDVKDGNIEIYNIYMQNAPQSFTAPGLPRFSIIGKNKKYYLGLGGYAKTTLSFDWNHPINSGTEFTTSAIPIAIQPGNGGLVQISAATSNLFANFVALPGTKNQLGVYISGNFLAEDYQFQLQFAYMKYRGFTVGYNYGLFADLAAAPPTIDYENAPGFTIIPNAVIDYAHAFNSKWSVGIGAELPIASATTNKYTYMVNQRIPDIPAYVQFNWGKGGNSWVRLSGMLRNMQYRDVVAGKNHNNVGFGGKVSGSATMGKFVTYYQFAYGKGISSYFQDIYDAGMDMMPDPETPGKLRSVTAWGGYFGVQYNFSKKVFASATYSQVRDYAHRYDGGVTEWGNQYKYAQYALVNVFWNILPNLQTGLEYIWGRRMNMDGHSGQDNRIQTMLQLNF